MTVKRSKKSKPKKKPQTSFMSRVKIVEQTNYLNLAIFILALQQEFGFGKKRLARVLESYLALMSEVADGRRTVKEMTKDANEMSGIDVEEILKDVMENNYEEWKAKVEALRK